MEEESGSSRLSVARKTVVALVLFALIAGFAWQTMEPGKLRTLVMIVLGAFALRLILGLRYPR